MVVFIFFISNIDNKKRVFEENFLLANIKSDVVCKIYFLTMSNVDIDFLA